MMHFFKNKFMQSLLIIQQCFVNFVQYKNKKYISEIIVVPSIAVLSYP